MNQLEFYSLPEVLHQIEVQKKNPYGSKEHKEAFDEIGKIANRNGCGSDYRKHGGGIYD